MMNYYIRLYIPSFCVHVHIILYISESMNVPCNSTSAEVERLIVGQLLVWSPNYSTAKLSVENMGFSE